MSTTYRKKMVISGSFVEIYEYPKAIHKGFKITTNEIKDRISRIRSLTWQKSQFALTRTRRAIRRYINSNTDMTKFVTLTFAENITNVDVANYEFKKFIERLKYKYGEIKYISVVEFQRRGAVHYHLIINLPYVKASQLESIWNNGFIKVNRIRHCDNVGAYVSKYLTKESCNLLFCKKKFFRSVNLEKATEIVEQAIFDKLLEWYKIKDKTPIFQTIIAGDYIGSINYYQFKLDFN